MPNKMLCCLRRTLLIALSLITLIGSVGCNNASVSTDTTTAKDDSGKYTDESFDADIKSKEQPALAASSDRMNLYVDGSNACVTLEDKNTGNIWTTNPVKRNEDPLAQGVNLDQLCSQILLEYVSQGKKTTVDSFSQSISLQQYSFYPIDNGIGVNYLIGKKKRVFIVPRALSVERYEEIKNKITDEFDLTTFESYYKKVVLKDLASEADRALFLEVFPILKERPIYYFVTPGTLQFQSPGEQVASDFMLEQVEQVFVNVGYTAEDMERDHQENKVNIAQDPDYSVELRLEYRLDGNDLTVCIPENSIRYKRSVMQVTNIWINPFWGAADSTKEGYMFVPGGSGSLIHLNNGKTNLAAYETELVYGDDPLFEEAPTKQPIDIQAHLPVFGLKQNDVGFLGIVESGDGSVFIEADISGRTNSYNHVCPKFQLARPQHQETAIMNLTDFDIYPQKDLSGALQIRYIPLQKEQADYSGMANVYRDYLLKTGKIVQRTMQENLPFHLRVIGAVTYKRSMLGIPVDSPKTLTSYEETIQILDELKHAGVSNTILELSDWANGGRENSVYDRIKLMSALGGKKGFEKLLTYVNEQNVGFYPGVDVQRVREDTWLDSFRKKSMAARTLNKRIAYNYEYKLSTFEKIKGSAATLVSPRRYELMLKNSAADLERYDINGISVGTLGKVLASDYNTKQTIDRQQSLTLVQDQLKELSATHSVLVQAANEYALASAAVITDIPLTSENHYMCDRTIPFYQMVVHGLVPVSGTPMNYTGDFEKDRLALIETGSVPSFEFIYRDNYELKDTEYNIYGVNYKLWLTQAAELYQEMNTLLKDCQTAKIVDHRQVQPDVNCTTYDNGVSIIVNYNDEPVTYQNKTIEAHGYIRAEGKMVE